MRRCELVKKEKIAEVAAAGFEWRRGYEWGDADVKMAIR